MSEDPQRKLPAVQSEKSRAPSVFAPQPAHTGGVIDTWLTGWQAKQKTAAHVELAALNRAKADELDAYGEMAESYMRTSRIVHQLDELPEILALDRAERADKRAAGYAKIDEGREERAHQVDVARRRRQREIEEADSAIVEARRRTFNAEQGLENQERLKKVNLEIWESRKQADLADATRIRAMLRDELAESTSAKGKASTSLPELEELHATLVKQFEELAADGLTDEAEKYRGLILQLEETIALLRGT